MATTLDPIIKEGNITTILNSTEFYKQRNEKLNNDNNYIIFDKTNTKISSINIAKILKDYNTQSDENAKIKFIDDNKKNLKEKIAGIDINSNQQVDAQKMNEILLVNAAKLSAIKVLTLIYAVFAFLSINPPKEPPKFQTIIDKLSIFTSDPIVDYNPFKLDEKTIFEAVSTDKLGDTFSKCSEIINQGYLTAATAATVDPANAAVIINFNSANKEKFDKLVANIKTKLATSLGITPNETSATTFNGYCVELVKEHLKLQYEQALAKFNYKYALDSTALYANLSVNETG
jgi:hypothetical protein